MGTMARFGRLIGRAVILYRSFRTWVTEGILDCEKGTVVVRVQAIDQFSVRCDLLAYSRKF